MEEQWTYKTDDQIYPPTGMQSSEPHPDGVDWDDDSGAVHTVTHTYKMTKEDGWQANQNYHEHRMSRERRRNRPQKIKGMQVGVSYSTDDYRVVIPFLIVFGLLMTAVCVVLTVVIPPFGIFFDVVWVMAVVGIIRQRHDKKWRNQAKRRKEQKEKEDIKSRRKRKI